ncbi:ferredoxin--NADP reductase [Micromonospora sp. PTRAS2]
MGLLSSTPLKFADRWTEDDGVAVFAFTPSRPFRHIAGQHGLFAVKGGGAKPFSLASAPEDDQVVLATRLESGSRFKKALAALRPGDRVTMRGPIMKFTLDGAGDDVVFLAQGVGITPFRSLLRHISAAGLGVRSTLLHVGDGHAFKTETEQLASDARYHRDREGFAVDLKQVATNAPAATYYVSGVPQFIAETSAALKDLGIGRKQIRKDNFRGY